MSIFSRELTIAQRRAAVWGLLAYLAVTAALWRIS